MGAVSDRITLASASADSDREIIWRIYQAPGVRCPLGVGQLQQSRFVRKEALRFWARTGVERGYGEANK
jgi:hypothetical protein